MSHERRPRISVINDNAAFLELMSAILDEDAGYEVTLFQGEEMPMDELVASEPDLVIVDLILGGSSGWEIVTLARADDRLESIPIIICSADVNSLAERTDELEQIGGVHVLTKPFGIDQVTELVERLIGRSTPLPG